MIKIDQSSNALFLSHSANRISNRRRVKNVFDAILEGSSASDATELENTTSADSIGLNRLSLLNLHLIKPQEQKAMVEYGESLLSTLQRLQEEILLGELPYSDLKRLEDGLKNGPPLNLDNKDLSNIIADIQVRVAVELAKYTQ